MNRDSQRLWSQLVSEDEVLLGVVDRKFELTTQIPNFFVETLKIRGDKPSEGLIKRAFNPINLRKDVSLLTELLRMS